MITFVFLLAAAIATLFWAHMFLRRDRFESEPRSLLVKLFFAGAGVTAIAFVVNTAALLILPQQAVLILVAPTAEELLKIGAVLLVAYRSRHFTQVVDGSIYCISCAFGFSVVEDLLYGANYGSGAILLRTVLLPLGHPLFTGVAGHYIGRAKFENRNELIALGVVVAILLHMGWNGTLGLPGLVPNSLALLLLLLLLPVYIFFLVRFLRRMSGAEAQAIRRLVLGPS